MVIWDDFLNSLISCFSAVMFRERMGYRQYSYYGDVFSLNIFPKTAQRAVFLFFEVKRDLLRKDFVVYLSLD